MEYLYKTSIVVALFYSCYYLFLHRDTFFQSNRWFLLTGLVAAFGIPLIIIPIYIEQISVPAQDFMFVGTTANQASANNPFEITSLLPWIYGLGVLFFCIRFAIQFYSLSLVFLRNRKKRHERHTLIETQDDLAPFSFFNLIVYNPRQFNKEELRQIITHEKVHARQWHSLDILITHLASIVLWFNPVIWMYKKTLQQNLEFIADQNTQSKVDCKKSYQYLLLKTGAPNHQLALTNNFYNSLIKKRIVMLHKKRSKISNHWKFTLILPLLALFLMSFNVKEILVEREDEMTHSTTTETMVNDHEVHDIVITKDHTEADLNKLMDQLAKKGITLKFKGIKRNDSGEITSIKINVSSENSKANYNLDSDDPIEAISISIDNDDDSISIGNASNMHFGKGYSFITSDGHGKVHKEGTKTFVYTSEYEVEHEHDGDHDDEHEEVIIIKKDGKVHELKEGHKIKNVHVISTDDDHKIIEIDEDDDHQVIIKKNSKVIKKIVQNREDEKAIKIQTLASGKGEKVLFMNSGDDKPLFVLDGKIVDKSVIDDLDSDAIETVEVLKGDSATEEYGDKAKDGVVKITTKQKKD